MPFSTSMNRERRCVIGNLRFARITVTDAPVSSGDGSEVDLPEIGANMRHVAIAVGVNRTDEEFLRLWINASANTPTYEEGSITVSAVTVDDDGEIFAFGW